ncbi:MAG: acyl-CoA dehydrogenase family protein [Sphingomonadales bacterium]
MDFQYTEDQAALVSALQSIMRDHQEIPQSERLNFHYHDAALQRILDESGFLDAAREMGPLEAALVVIEVARSPVVVETGVSALVVRHLMPDAPLPGPVAIASADKPGQAFRNLPIARTVLIEDGADVVVYTPVDGDVEPVKSIYAYPYGRFRAWPDLSRSPRLRGARDTLVHWARVALAAEFAGAALAAVDFTIDHVKERKVFGRPVGSFQTVQHRLVLGHQIARSTYYLALKAAWSRDPNDAAIAACYAQQNVKGLLFDMHQFNGGMGVTNEHLLHFWAYRLRALQSEAGGVYGAALDIADRLWGQEGAAA